jgi:hypothetical protein
VTATDVKVPRILSTTRMARAGLALDVLGDEWRCRGVPRHRPGPVWSRP